MAAARRPALDVAAVGPFVAHVDALFRGLAGAVPEARACRRRARGPRASLPADRAGTSSCRRPFAPSTSASVPLLHLHAALAGRSRSITLWRWLVDAAGAALQPGRLPGHGPFDRLQIVGRQLVGMGQPALDEHVADRAHDHQQQGPHGGEAHDPPQHHFARPHRLGHDRVQRAVLDVGRQAQRTEKQRQQQHQVAGGGEHEVEVQPRGIDALADRETSRRTAGSG